MCVSVYVSVISDISGMGHCNAALLTPTWITFSGELLRLLLELTGHRDALYVTTVQKSWAFSPSTGRQEGWRTSSVYAVVFEELAMGSEELTDSGQLHVTAAQHAKVTAVHLRIYYKLTGDDWSFSPLGEMQQGWQKTWLCGRLH